MEKKGTLPHTLRLLDYTRGAEDLLVFTKQTRRGDGAVRNWDDVRSLSQEAIEKEISYALSTISGPWEFIDYIFHIGGVTRAFTHQIVRHRVGTSYSQESLRVADKRGFKYYTPHGAEETHYGEAMDSIAELHNELVEMGLPTQDARGVLPTNILTSITAKFNLRSLNTLMNTRLCVRTAGEFQDVALMMRDSVLEVHPWAEPALRPFCGEWGACKFPRFDKCPIKASNPQLHKSGSELAIIMGDWEKYKGLSTQPK